MLAKYAKQRLKLYVPAKQVQITLLGQNKILVVDDNSGEVHETDLPRSRIHALNLKQGKPVRVTVVD